MPEILSTEISMEIDTPLEDSAKKSNVRLSDIVRILLYISTGVEKNQPRLIIRAIRQNSNIRRNITPGLLKSLVANIVAPDSTIYAIMNNAISALDSSSLIDISLTSSELLSINEASIKRDLPEIEVYIANLILSTLIKDKNFEPAANFACCVLERIKQSNRRSLDALSSKFYSYYSLAHEKVNRMENIRSNLLSLYRTACLHRDSMSQVVLINLILRNYLHYNLYAQAQTFASKAPFPEEISNNQHCRYLYYMGRIQAIHLEYSDSYSRLTQALRKVPQEYGLGFQLEIQKLAVIVQLLMGDVPERTLFNQPEMKSQLKPYLELTKAVRMGDLLQFDKVVKSNSLVFKADKTFSLVQRLGHNVLKTGLRRISLSYSRIALIDIKEKLLLPTAAAAEYICAKAIKDGVIEATLDHENGWLISNQMIDVYSTEEPQKAFHRRITFCLDTHNEAVKSMRYPPDAYKKEHKKNSGNSEDVNEKSIEEIIKEMEDDMDDL